MTLSGRRGIGRLLVAVGVAAVLAGAWPMGSAHAEKDLAEMVQAAKTAADHEAVAARYAEEAAAAKAKAEAHRKMGAFYKGIPSVAGGKTLSAMPEHCEKLVKSLEDQAAMYTAMAAAEREHAKSMK